MPGFDLEAARKAGYSDDEILSHLTASRKFDVNGAVQAGYSKQDIIGHLAGGGPLAAAVAAPDPGKAVLDTVVDLGKGALKGFASTVVHGGDMIRRATGQERIIHDPEVQALITPTGTAQNLAYGAEKIGEFLAPSGLIGAGAKAWQAATAGARGAQALNIAGRAVLEGASATGVAGLQTGGDAEAMRNAGLTAGIATGAIGTLAHAAGPAARILKQSAERQYGRVLNPTKQGNKFLSQTQVVPGLIERRVTAGTMKSLEGKAAAQVEKWGQAIGDEFDNLPVGTAVDLAPILQRLEQSASGSLTIKAGGKAIPKGPYAKQALDNLDALKQTLADVAEVNPQTKALEVPVERLRELRQYFDDVAAKAGRYEGKALADQSLAEAHGMAADAIRDELAQAFPSIAKLNREYAFWKNAHKVVSDTLLRREGQAKPLGRKIAGAAGAAAGMATSGLGGLALGKTAAEAFERLTTSTAWGTINAVWKDKLAVALAKGHRGEAEFWVRKMASSLGGAAATFRPSLEHAQNTSQ